MTNVASIRVDRSAPASRDSSGPWMFGGQISDILTRLVVALWFMVQGTNFVRAITSTVSQSGVLGLDALGAAGLGAQICLFFFFMMMAWLTLVRPRPVAKAPGWRPRVTALLGTYLLYGLPFLPAPENLGIGLHLLAAALII